RGKGERDDGCGLETHVRSSHLSQLQRPGALRGQARQFFEAERLRPAARVDAGTVEHIVRLLYQTSETVGEGFSALAEGGLDDLLEEGPIRDAHWRWSESQTDHR